LSRVLGVSIEAATSLADNLYPNLGSVPTRHPFLGAVNERVSGLYWLGDLVRRLGSNSAEAADVLLRRTGPPSVANTQFERPYKQLRQQFEQAVQNAGLPLSYVAFEPFEAVGRARELGLDALVDAAIAYLELPQPDIVGKIVAGEWKLVSKTDDNDVRSDEWKSGLWTAIDPHLPAGVLGASTQKEIQENLFALRAYLGGDDGTGRDVDGNLLQTRYEQFAEYFDPDVLGALSPWPFDNSFFPGNDIEKERSFAFILGGFLHELPLEATELDDAWLQVIQEATGVPAEVMRLAYAKSGSAPGVPLPLVENLFLLRNWDVARGADFRNSYQFQSFIDASRDLSFAVGWRPVSTVDYSTFNSAWGNEVVDLLLQRAETAAATMQVARLTEVAAEDNESALDSLYARGAPGLLEVPRRSEL